MQVVGLVRGPGTWYVEVRFISVGERILTREKAFYGHCEGGTQRPVNLYGPGLLINLKSITKGNREPATRPAKLLVLDLGYVYCSIISRSCASRSLTSISFSTDGALSNTGHMYL